MRSRYCAFAVGDSAYLLRTWYSTTRPRRLELDAGVRWSGLDITDRAGGGPFDTVGTVAFRAHFTTGGRSAAQQENSRFVREDGDWRYVGPQLDL